MKQYFVKPGSKVELSQWDPNDEGGFKGEKKKALKEVARLDNKLDALQELLYAGHKHKVLIVLQAMDTAGKDGTIRHVFEGVNPQGVRVASFKLPTPEELDHDFLWRIHKEVPAAGEMVIFNRSHYEDVLVVRVHKLITPAICRKRYDQINAFERLLAENGTIILKFFLYIDRDEQKARLQARLDDSSKQWKFNVGDLKERKLWSEYMHAYEEALTHTSTAVAPWVVVPANHKWYRDLVVSTILVETLERLNLKYPPPAERLEGVVIE
ncbi:MAG TPA: polyphosphate kinase 2 family protein [Anaerolineales bacterium]|nr:polyphosphate kinase 2 family protein [Anaerolineales bacterium]